MDSGMVKFSDVEKAVFELRGQQVILDADVASLYGVETKRVNEAVKNKRQIELNYLKKRQGELIDLMRTTTDKTEQVRILQELNNLTKLIAGKNKDGE